jgi:hypothetical protein
MRTIVNSNTFLSVWYSTLMIPAYVAAASAVLLILHLIILSKSVKKVWLRLLSPTTQAEEGPSALFEEATRVNGFFSEVKAFISRHGGSAIFAYKLARFIGCLVFWALSLATFILEVREEHSVGAGKVSGRKHRKSRQPHDGYVMFSRAEWLQFALCMTAVSSSLLPVSVFAHSLQAYAYMLGLISVTVKPRWSRLVSNHLATLLLAMFAVFAYRDLWPLITFHQRPKDLKEGALLWAKVVVLFLTSVVFPLVSPRQYIPVDPAVRRSFQRISCHLHSHYATASYRDPTPRANFFVAVNGLVYLAGSHRLQGVSSSSPPARRTSSTS